MYNEEKKLAWMDDAERRNVLSRRRVAASHLSRLDDAVETPLGADIFDLMREGRKAEVIEHINRNFGFTTYSTIRRFVQTVNAYLDWRFAVDASTIASNGQRFGTYEFSLVNTFRGLDYIKSEDELSAALSHHRIEDGELLPVFASLAWIGYEPTGMIIIRQADVNDKGANIIVEGKTVNDGFVNDTLLYYSRNERYLKGAYRMFSVKESGEKFLRNIVPANNARPQANMLTKIRDMACKTELLNGSTISYAQLKQAGEFKSWLAAERAGEHIDIEWFKDNLHINALTAKEHLNEYLDYKTALGV